MKMFSRRSSCQEARSRAASHRRSRSSRRRRGADRALQPLGRQREVGIAGEIARQNLGGVDHHRGAAELRGRKDLLVADHHHVAAEHEVAFAGRDADGVDVLGLLAMRMWL
jgi:hypothetical protein